MGRAGAKVAMPAEVVRVVAICVVAAADMGGIMLHTAAARAATVVEL